MDVITIPEMGKIINSIHNNEFSESMVGDGMQVWKR